MYHINNLDESADNITGDPRFVQDEAGAVTGSWTAVVYDGVANMTYLTDGSAPFTTDSLTGQLVNPYTAQPRQAAISSNTATTLAVWGDVTAFARAGVPYVLVDHHIEWGSAAIDAAYGTDSPANDRDGVPRPTFWGYDIGAYEYRGPGPDELAMAPNRVDFGGHTGEALRMTSSVLALWVGFDPATTGHCNRSARCDRLRLDSGA
jgi:hypothetical protein